MSDAEPGDFTSDNGFQDVSRPDILFFRAARAAKMELFTQILTRDSAISSYVWACSSNIDSMVIERHMRILHVTVSLLKTHSFLSSHITGFSEDTRRMGMFYAFVPAEGGVEIPFHARFSRYTYLKETT